MKNTKYIRIMTLLSIICAPLFVHADETSFGGFITSPLWLSTDVPVADTSVFVYTPLYNPFDTSIRATVEFTEGQNIIGEDTQKIPPHSSLLFRTSWTPQKGTRILTAKVTDTRTLETKKVPAKKISLVKNTLPTVKFSVRDGASAQKNGDIKNPLGSVSSLIENQARSFVPVWVSDIGETVWGFFQTLFK